jgi:hypothetical protein
MNSRRFTYPTVQELRPGTASPLSPLEVASATEGQGTGAGERRVGQPPSPATPLGDARAREQRSDQVDHSAALIGLQIVDMINPICSMT